MQPKRNFLLYKAFPDKPSSIHYLLLCARPVPSSTFALILSMVCKVIVFMSLFPNRLWISWRMGLCVICLCFPSSYLIVNRWSTISYQMDEWMNGWMLLFICTLALIITSLSSRIKSLWFCLFCLSTVFFYYWSSLTQHLNPTNFYLNSLLQNSTQMSSSVNYSNIILCIYLHNKKFSTHLIVIISWNI